MKKKLDVTILMLVKTVTIVILMVVMMMDDVDDGDDFDLQVSGVSSSVEYALIVRVSGVQSVAGAFHPIADHCDIRPRILIQSSSAMIYIYR